MSPWQEPDPQESGAQRLEDLATAYWLSEALFAAVELDLFSRLGPEGSTAAQLAERLDLNPGALGRFLDALCAMGLLSRSGETFFNTRLAARHLVRGSAGYQGNSVLWRKYLTAPWRDLTGALKAGGRVFDSGGSGELAERIERYIRAMDDVARVKTREILPLFDGLTGRILDVGAGSGAVSAGFLERFPGMRATLVDLPQVLEVAEGLLHQAGLGERATLCPANILEPWPVEEEAFDLVLLSNVLHAYAEAEAGWLIEEAARRLSPRGLLVVHDFFRGHSSQKATLFDLNMLLNTFNGKVFSAGWVRKRLTAQGLQVSECIALGSDTGVIVAAREAADLDRLRCDPISRLAARVRALGFRRAIPIAADSISVADWAPQRCRFGCSEYGKPHCPPNSPTPSETRELLKSYSRAMLLEGEPPTREFQLKVLEAEKEGFAAGFYKALAYWGGPCSLFLPECPAVCRNTRMARPSMEAAGIDVFETVRRAGLRLRPLTARDDFAKYFALLLLE